jgi:hypothetical protein
VNFLWGKCESTPELASPHDAPIYSKATDCECVVRGRASSSIVGSLSLRSVSYRRVARNAPPPMTSGARTGVRHEHAKNGVLTMSANAQARIYYEPREFRTFLSARFVRAHLFCSPRAQPNNRVESLR